MDRGYRPDLVRRPPGIRESARVAADTTLSGRSGGNAGAPRQGPAHAARARLRPGAHSEHGRLLELRDLVHDHLDPLGDADAVRHRSQLRRPGDGGVRLADRLGLRDHRRARDGGDRVEVPDRRWSLLLGVEDGRPGLGLVHRLVQPDRPDRDHRRDRLRRRDCSPTRCSSSSGRERSRRPSTRSSTSTP